MASANSVEVTVRSPTASTTDLRMKIGLNDTVGERTVTSTEFAAAISTEFADAMQAEFAAVVLFALPTV